MLAAAGGRGDLLVSRDAHKSVVAGELLDYLRTGLAAGMQLPDPAGPSLGTIRVVTQTASHP